MPWLAGMGGWKVLEAGLKGYRIAKETKVYLTKYVHFREI